MHRNKIIVGNWNYLVLIVISVLGIILDSFKLIPSNLMTSILLLVVCTFTINQIISNTKTQELIEELRLNKGTTKKVDIREYYSLLEYYVNHAEKTIDGTYHQSTDPTTKDLAERHRYFQSIDRIIKKQKVRVRRITTINSEEKLQVIKEWVNTYGKCPNFHLRYSPITESCTPPPMSVTVIDSKVALIAGITTGYHVLSENNVDLVIQGEELGGVFQEYYDRY